MIEILRHFCICFFTLGFVANIGATTPYNRALALRETDPVEAEALLVQVLQQSAGDKRHRAARYDLFYLRLRHMRLAEAFRQGVSKPFSRRYVDAVATRFHLNEAVTRRLISRLAASCEKKEISEATEAYFFKAKFGAAVYEYAIRVLQSCQVTDAESLLPKDILVNAAETERELALKLLKVRYGIAEFALAEQQLAQLTLHDAELLQANPALNAQFVLLQARVDMEKADLPAAGARCKAILGKGTQSMRSACRFLLAYHLAKTGEYSEAYKLVRNEEISPVQIDNRLLRFALAVGSGALPPAKLHKFTRRASYRYTAQSLRELAQQVLAEMPPERQ